MKNLITKKIKNYENMKKDDLVLEIIKNFLIKTLIEKEVPNEFEFKIDKEINECYLIDKKTNKYIYILKYENIENENLTNHEFDLDFEDKYLKNSTYFSSKISMNIDKIIENPEYIALYLDEPNSIRMNDRKDLFLKYGINFITKHFEMNESNSKISAEIPFILCFQELKRIDDEFDTKGLFADLPNILGIQTQSKRGGVQNVRDIYPLTMKAKQKQIIGIISTLKKEMDKPINEKGYKQWFTEKGKEKDFNFIGSETLIKTFHENENRVYYLITTNGGLIDGQNSVDSLSNIYNGLLDLKDYKLKGDRTKKFILDEIIKTFNLLNDDELNIEKVDEIINFLEESYVGVNPTKAKNFEMAVDTADSKNASIQVEKESLDVSKYIVEAIELSKFAYKSNYYSKESDVVYENLNVNINYPKKRREFYDNENLIEFQDIAAIYSNYLYILEKDNKNFENNIAKDMSKLRSFTKPLNKDTFIHSFVDDFIDKEKNSQEIKDIKSKIENSNNLGVSFLSYLNLDDDFVFVDLEDIYEHVENAKLSPEFKCLFDIMIKEHKDLKERYLKEATQKKDKDSIVLKNTDLYYSLLKLIKVLNNKTNDINTKELYRLNYSAYIFVILIIKIKMNKINNLIDFVNDPDFERNIDFEINLFKSKLYQIKNIYQVPLINEIFHRTKTKKFSAVVDSDKYKSFDDQLDLIKEFFNNDIDSLLKK